MTEGALRIRRSQSAASIQIKRLEEVLGRRVFDRHGRGVVLTETGHRLLPIALFDRDCWWRDAALAFMRDLGRPFRIVYSRQSVAGVKAAFEAGIAVGLLGESSLSDRLVVLDEEQGFGPMPSSKLILSHADSDDSEPIAAMKNAIREAFRRH